MARSQQQQHSDFYRQLDPKRLREAADRLAGEIGGDQLLASASRRSALLLYDHPKGGLEGARGGFGAGSAALTAFAQFCAESVMSAAQEISPLMAADIFRQFALGQRSISLQLSDGRSGGDFFWAIVLIYVVLICEHVPKMKSSAIYKELREGMVIEHVRNVLSDRVEKIERYSVLRRRLDSGGASWLLDDLFGIANVGIDDVLRFFEATTETPARFVCYRFTTKLKRPNAKNRVTKSYLEIGPASVNANVVRFTHEYYKIIDGERRTTTGIVLPLDESYYLVGGSRRADVGHSVAKGLKAIAIPTADEHARHSGRVRFGLFLSNDSQWRPIIGRLLLVRVSDSGDVARLLNVPRIPESELLEDVARVMADKVTLTAEDKEWLTASIRHSGFSSNPVSQSAISAYNWDPPH